MSALAQITIHPSQFPQNVSHDLVDSLKSRQVNHKFHYDTVKQIQKWLAVHRAYSPWRTDAECATIYDTSYVETVKKLDHCASVQLVGLGCGDGTKDLQLLRRLKEGGKQITYVPVDVSAAMVLLARQTALAVLPEQNCFPFVCDLAMAEDFHSLLEQPSQTPKSARLITFFGMLPNFEPQLILPRLAQMLQPGHLMLLSANLAPGPDYAAGMQRIATLYDNELTQDWLMTFLYDLGVEKDDGQLRFLLEEGQSGLKRVAAYYSFNRARSIELSDQSFEFAPHDKIRLFFSYRHSPNLLRALLQAHHLQVLEQWVTASEEEGVFLVGT